MNHDPGWEDDLAEANRSKEGATFRYADALIMAAAALRTAFGIQYRQLSGFLAAMPGTRLAALFWCGPRKKTGQRCTL